MSKYGVFSSPNAGKYGPEKASYLDTFYAVRYYQNVLDRVVSFEKDTTRNRTTLLSAITTFLYEIIDGPRGRGIFSFLEIQSTYCVYI